MQRKPASDRRRRTGLRCSLAIGLCLGAVLAAGAQTPGPAAVPAASQGGLKPGEVLGPVEPAFFGLVMNREKPQLPWPGVPFGSWRLWDAYTTWAQLEPERGQWRFDRLDRIVDEARQHRVRLLLVLAHSPSWASARPGEPSAYRPGVAAEPAQIEDWRRYVKTVAERYKGRISEFQVWNEPSDRSHYSGSVDKLVELTCEARRILKAVDPANVVVSGGSAGGGGHIRYLDRFLASGGSACIDVVAHHFYVFSQGPEAMVPLIREVREVMRQRGVGHLPLWNTETGWWIGAVPGPDGVLTEPAGPKGAWRRLDPGAEAGSTIARAFLLSRAEGVSRFYWYGWTDGIFGLSDWRGLPKPAGDGWRWAVEQMMGKIVTGCAGAGSATACAIQSPNGTATVNVRWTDPTALTPRTGSASANAEVRLELR